MSKTSRSTNAMEVRLGIFWKIKVDDYIDSLNIDTTGKKIRAHEIAAYTVPEVMENAITVVLQHLRVRVKAGVSKFGYLLRK